MAAKKAERTSALEWARNNPGRASDYMSKLVVRPGDWFVICCRVSERFQNHRGNLADQEAVLRRVIEQGGGIVVGVVHHVGSGYSPSWLAEAVGIAEQHNAILVAESADRFIRPDTYDKENQSHRADEQDLGRLRRWTEGRPLKTLVHPDASLAQVRRQQTIRGQQAKGDAGGRPRKTPPGFKKARQERKRPIALRMRDRGLSLGEIATFLGVPRPTIQTWVRQDSKGV